MKPIINVALGLFLALSPCLVPVAVAEMTINVPTDAKTKYTALNITKRDDGLVEVTTKREGISGTTYSKRLVDCANSQFMYLGSGDTLEKMNSGGQADSKMASLTEGSASTYVSAYACQNAR